MRFRSSALLLGLSLIVLTSASTCEGSTEPENWMLSLSTAGSGSGSVTAAPAGNADGGYADGTVVTITATAAAGSDFTGWDELDVKGCTEPKNPCSLTMSDRKSVVGNFVPSSGAARYDGLYTGTVVTTSIGTQPVNLTVVNGTVQGKVAPLFGSQSTFSGTVSSTGAFAALINAQSGPQFTCQTRLSGTITTSVVDGIMTATLTGNFQVESVPGSVGCGAGNPLPTGGWSATRDRVKTNKL